jgi:catechol 2,3-dioxygenase-like lactoylglutathione lyase family enzyme
MKENLNVDPSASATNHRVRCGNGANFELFEYQSPDQRTIQPKNSDYGGHHLAFYVDDIEATVAYLRSMGLKILGDIKTNTSVQQRGCLGLRSGTMVYTVRVLELPKRT